MSKEISEELAKHVMRHVKILDGAIGRLDMLYSNIADMPLEKSKEEIKLCLVDFLNVSFGITSKVVKHHSHLDPDKDKC